MFKFVRTLARETLRLLSCLHQLDHGDVPHAVRDVFSPMSAAVAVAVEVTTYSIHGMSLMCWAQISCSLSWSLFWPSLFFYSSLSSFVRCAEYTEAGLRKHPTHLEVLLRVLRCP
ncbi:unnamed protein product [Symbiodinium natans]|uniref:Uncharacterized protein n=1 Tax=Symbiodinium natans TaxID=878477 RepID=A0A812GJ67_9DINO|nr:unnamed protein product [Symbiodinium natans]